MKTSRADQVNGHNRTPRGSPAELDEAPPRAIPPESTAAYIADITTELASLARGSKLEVLGYLLDIAQLEAANTARRLAREAVGG